MFAGEVLNGRDGLLQIRNGKPWSGICPPDLDAKGNPRNFPAVFAGGVIVEYLTHETYNQLLKEN